MRSPFASSDTFIASTAGSKMSGSRRAASAAGVSSLASGKAAGSDSATSFANVSFEKPGANFLVE